MELAGIVPVDENVTSYNMAGRPLLGLPDDSPAYVAVGKIARRIGLEALKGGP
jgi:CO dehydrogenase nickel-insertion accessory protein CooC1